MNFYLYRRSKSVEGGGRRMRVELSKLTRIHLAIRIDIATFHFKQEYLNETNNNQNEANILRKKKSQNEATSEHQHYSSKTRVMRAAEVWEDESAGTVDCLHKFEATIVISD